MGRVQGKVCVVTGAARGLGLAAVERLLAEGARVMMTDVNSELGASQCARLSKTHEVAFLSQDVTKVERWTEVLAQTTQRWGRLDVMVNNAGIGTFASVEAETLDHWRTTLAVNLDGVFLGTQAAIAHMKGHGGSIVNICSIEGLIGESIIPAYNASKGGVRIFTRSAAIHCARSGYNIRINNVCPGFVDTQMVAGAVASLPAEQAQAFAAATLARIPLGRFGLPTEIAQAVLFLASDESSYMTGADLVIDGGMTA
jgi:NAD(P)-dependent dehydrogenase (short-subunit alcohol dehydrogenase family)